FRYKLVNKHPHDSNAYTQGLQYENGTLYETTGIRGMSALQRGDLTSGKVIRSKELGNRYFGEGMTFVGDSIYVLTYQVNTCFSFDSGSFELIRTFQYDADREGRGLIFDWKSLIKPDSSNLLYFLDPVTFRVTHTVSVFDNNGPVATLNELE